MNEIEVLKWHLARYHATLSLQMDRLYNALEELQRLTIFLIKNDNDAEEKIDAWLQEEGFSIDEDGFFQSIPLLSAFRKGEAPDDAISISWGKNLKSNPLIRRRIYCHRNIGSHIKHIHDRLGDVGWIYYQDASNTSLQYPYIDQCKAITHDFDWTSYHTFLSVNPQNNPQREIRWTPPSVDYAGEGIILSVSIPVWNDDTFVGLWSIDLPIRYLYRDFYTSKPLHQQSQFIVDQQGMLLLHDKLKSEINQSQGQLILRPLSKLGGDWEQIDLKKLIESKYGTLDIADADRIKWTFCYHFVPGLNWILFSGLPNSTMEAAATQRLQRAFQQISSGNFAYRIEDNSNTTLSMLVEEFNKMSVRLGQAEEHRKTMEKQLLQAQKMEAVGRLAGGVAHDYNNMLSIILGYTEIALLKMNDDDPLKQDLKTILKAGHRSKELTRQLLAFARKQTIVPRNLDINHIVSSMLKMLKPLIGEDIELIWKPGESIHKVFIDPSQVDQILANLCVNARDAINGVGKIIIETANVEFNDEYCSVHQGFIPGSFVQLAVTDDGPGMDSETLNNIFEPFFSTKPMGNGTGLGLATVYGITKQNNGFINVYSEPEYGATFKIYLPKTKDQHDKAEHRNNDKVHAGDNETILVVEDDADIIKLLARMIKDLGYQTIVANSPLQAIEMAQSCQHPIDLLLTDVIMPDLNGKELSKRIKYIFPKLKVLYMSGYTSNVVVHRGVLDKNVHLLQKPFSKNELAGKIQEVLTASSDQD